MSKKIEINRIEIEKFAISQATKIKTVANKEFEGVEVMTLAAGIMSAVEVSLRTDPFKTGVEVKIQERPQQPEKPKSKIIIPEKPKLIIKK